MTCTLIQWLIAVEYFDDPTLSIPKRIEKVCDAIEECQQSHLGDDCDICRAS